MWSSVPGSQHSLASHKPGRFRTWYNRAGTPTNESVARKRVVQNKGAILVFTLTGFRKIPCLIVRHLTLRVSGSGHFATKRGQSYEINPDRRPPKCSRCPP